MKPIFRMASVLLMFLGASTIAYAQTPNPNIVVIIADDMGWSQTSATATSLNNPSDFYETPVIASLAAQGIAFPNGYVNGANCAPTRAAILSGQWASRPDNNVFAVNGLNRGGSNTLLVGPSQGLSNGEDEIPASAITIAETIKTAGYTTAHFGKYHSGGSMNNAPTDQGFDVNFGGASDGAPGSYFAALSGGNWEFHPRIGPELDMYAAPYTAAESIALVGDNSIEGTAKHVTDAMGDAAIDFMNANNASPFFMHFSNYAIHGPWGQANARPDLYAKYVAKNASNPSQIGHDNVAQAAILEGMDQTIGRIITYLQNTPDPRNPGNMLSANTLVYFISDNGGANGPEDNAPLKGMKGEYTEGGIRSVTFAWSEGLLANAGTPNMTPVVAFDLYPTVIDIAGGTLPSGYAIDGVSQWPLLTGAATTLNREALYWHFPGYIANAQRDQRPVSIIRKGDYKLIHYYETASYALYNLATDIGEDTNLLAGTPDTTILTIANDMSTLLRAHLIDVAAPLPTYRSSGATVPLPEIIEVTTPPVDMSCVSPTTYAALWNFDTATLTNDYSANGQNPISIVGAVSYDIVDYKEGDQSVVFDGSTKIQYSQNPAPFLTAPTAARSIGMWIKPAALSGIQNLFEEGGGLVGVVIRLNGGTVETIVRNSSTVSDNLSTAFPTDGDWHHIALVYDGASTTQTLYLDGVVAASSTAAPASIPTHIGAGGIAGVQKKDSFGATADHFYTGKMDAVAVYESVLTAAEVATVACIETTPPPPACVYSLINSEDFETGWGIWVDGGSDARRNIGDAAYANSGDYCIRLRDNTDTSVMTTTAIDASVYEEISVDFSYYCRSMDNSAEDFWLQLSTDGGTSFSTVEEWNLNDEFVNDQRFNDQVVINGPFSADTRLRFRADASGNQDWVYIDDVVINGCAVATRQAPAVTTTVIQQSVAAPAATPARTVVMYPNPFSTQIRIAIEGDTYTKATVQVFNLLGQLVFEQAYDQQGIIIIASDRMEGGHYFVKTTIDQQQFTQVLIKM